MSIYVCVNPDDLHRLRPVLALFFQQCIGLQTNELPEHNPELKYPVLMLLNEFTALGKIPIVAESMSYLPGYNVRVLLVIQASSQLREVYGVYAAETMLKSVAARIVFAPKDYTDAKEISDELGNTTVRVRSESRPIALSLDRKGGRHRSASFSPQARPLMLPQEVKELGTESALILYEGLRPILCRKIRYYRDRIFTRRLLPPPPRATPVACHSRPPRRPAPNPAPPVESNAQAIPTPTSPEAPLVESTLDQLESMTLEDLPESVRNLTYEQAGERPTEDEMQLAAQLFIDTLRKS